MKHEAMSINLFTYFGIYKFSSYGYHVVLHADVKEEEIFYLLKYFSALSCNVSVGSQSSLFFSSIISKHVSLEHTRIMSPSANINTMSSVNQVDI